METLEKSPILLPPFQWNRISGDLQKLAAPTWVAICALPGYLLSGCSLFWAALLDS